MVVSEQVCTSRDKGYRSEGAPNPLVVRKTGPVLYRYPTIYWTDPKFST